MLNLPEKFDTYEEARREGFLKVKDLKDRGENVVGIFCTYTPIELIYAADAHAVSLCGTSDEPITHGERDLPKNLCPLIKSSYGFAVSDTCPYFYLSDSEVTTIYETRAKQHDYISIAEFELVEDIEVIDFTILDKTSPFSVEDITSYALNKIHLNRVSSEIAKPLRRTDSQLQYLPTQYLVDFIKWKGNSGIKFKSSLYPAGTNYTVFNAELFKCNNVKVYDVAKVDYYFELVKRL